MFFLIQSDDKSVVEILYNKHKTFPTEHVAYFPATHNINPRLTSEGELVVEIVWFCPGELQRPLSVGLRTTFPANITANSRRQFPTAPGPAGAGHYGTDWCVHYTPPLIFIKEMLLLSSTDVHDPLGHQTRGFIPSQPHRYMALFKVA